MPFHIDSQSLCSNFRSRKTKVVPVMWQWQLRIACADQE
jgi:hypothetical protein